MEILQYEFMQHALIASVMASIICGVIGTLIVCNRLSFLAGAVAHAAYGGIGLAFAFGFPVLVSTLSFSVAASILMALIILKKNAAGSFENSSDAAIGLLWTAGMAFGIILIELSPGYAADLMSFLFGSILAVPKQDLIIMAVFNVLIFLVLGHFRQGLWAVTADLEFSRARGLPVNLLFMLLVAFISIAVVLLIRVAGLILVLALLTIPPAMALKFHLTIYKTMLLTGLLSLTFCLCGLVFSYYTDISSGAGIIAVATLAYVALLCFENLRQYKKN